MFDFLLQPALYIKLILSVVLLGCSIFEVVVFNRLRTMNRTIHQPASSIVEGLVVVLFVATIILLLTTLAIL